MVLRRGSGKPVRSNRTFMELKFISIFGHIQNLRGSNRTFMELKFSSYRELDSLPCSSNRTFMELKLEPSVYRFSLQDVLIVPLWN